MLNAIKKTKSKIVAAMTMLAVMITTMPQAYAAGIGDSKLATGTAQLIQDTSGWLMGLGVAVAGVAIVYFLVRRANADEGEVRRWNNRIVIAIVSAVGTVIAIGLLNIIVGYYQ
jgi:sulfite exporter TauE/SafE